MTLNKFKVLKQEIIEGRILSQIEVLELCKMEEKELLYCLANDLREHFRGNNLEMCSILNAKSGKCTEDCKWCAQSRYHNTHIEKYDLIPEEEALRQARISASQGVAKFSLVTSGRTISDTDLEKACATYRLIGDKVSITLCASMGLLTKPQLIKLYEAGVRHYHCNLETARSYFPKLCSTHTYEEKLQTLQWAKEAGLEICCGGIIGMEETLEQRIEFAHTLRETEATSIPVNVLNPIKGTPLENIKPLSDDEILLSFAVFRILNPKANIRFAGGRNLFSHIQEKVLKAGVSAAMVGDLLTTLGSNIQEDLKMFDHLGYNIIR
jgi:biotin synthase